MSVKSSRAAFTLIELLFSVILLGVCTVMGVYGWNNIYRGERTNSAQAALDMDVRTAIERIRSEARMSAIERMVFYPDGSGPYVAISLPIAVDRDEITGLVPMSSTSNMIFDTTVVYHISRGAPEKLIRTSFYPRDNTATVAQRTDQLEQVVAAGSGAGAELDGEAATSRVIFSNFFDWKIDPTAGAFDAYAPDFGRRPVVFGSFPLSPGAHQYTFMVGGKNAASSGYKLGLDTLICSPTTHPLEAEDQKVVAALPSAAREYIAAGSWSGRHQLLAVPEGDQASFTLEIENDRWEETNFEDSYAGTDNHVKAEFDTTLLDNVIRLAGTGVVWNVRDQTDDMESYEANSTGIGNKLENHAFRVLIESDALMHDGRLLAYSSEHNSSLWTTAAPPHSYLRFRIPGGYDMSKTCYATIAVADPDSNTNAFPGIVASSLRYLRLYQDPADINYSYGVLSKGTASDLSPMDIDRTNSYVVSFWVYRSEHAGAKWVAWEDRRAPISAMTQIATNISSETFVKIRTSPSWQDDADVAARDNDVQAYSEVRFLEDIVTVCPRSGTYVSRIFDTTLPNPSYLSMDWEADVPGGTKLKISSRTGSLPDLSDASWAGQSAGAAPGFGRYCQFRAELESDNWLGLTPRLRRVVTRWEGDLQIVDLAGMVTVGPDYGAFDLTIDGEPLVRGLRFDMTIFKDVATGIGTRRMHSSMSMEVAPRNSGL